MDERAGGQELAGGAMSTGDVSQFGRNVVDFSIGLSRQRVWGCPDCCLEGSSRFLPHLGCFHSDVFPRQSDGPHGWARTRYLVSGLSAMRSGSLVA